MSLGLTSTTSSLFIAENRNMHCCVSDNEKALGAGTRSGVMVERCPLSCPDARGRARCVLGWGRCLRVCVVVRMLDLAGGSRSLACCRGGPPVAVACVEWMHPLLLAHVGPAGAGDHSLLRLMTILTEAFFTLVSSHFVAFSLFSARHLCCCFKLYMCSLSL